MISHTEIAGLVEQFALFRPDRLFVGGSFEVVCISDDNKKQFGYFIEGRSGGYGQTVGIGEQ